MSRSRVLVALLAAWLFALTARPAPAQEGSLLDAIGSVDYTRGRSVVQVGSWARYRITTTTSKGVTDDCTVTIMIAGEEEWWGEECFWVETVTRRGKNTEVAAATLMSSAIFEDSTPLRNVLLYQRKRVLELDENGTPVLQTLRRGPGAVKGRTVPRTGLTLKVDTLGTDTVKTARGDLVCLKLRSEKGISATSQGADSSQYGETREVRVTERSRLVPVTGTAHEEIDFSDSRRTWLTGHSKDASPLQLVERTRTVMELLDYGTRGVEAMYVPAEFRRSLAQQRASPAPKPKAPVAKPRQPKT